MYKTDMRGQDTVFVHQHRLITISTLYIRIFQIRHKEKANTPSTSDFSRRMLQR